MKFVDIVFAVLFGVVLLFSYLQKNNLLSNHITLFETHSSALSDNTDFHEVPITDIKQVYTEECVKYCGEGFYYDRMGKMFNNKEKVCVRYPLPCGYKCTKGWNIKHIKNTVYTCQEARQIQKIELEETHNDNLPTQMKIQNALFYSDTEKNSLLLAEVKKGEHAGRALVEELLKAGADIHIKDETGKSALLYAIDSYFIPNPHVSWLWLYFKDLHAKNKDGSDAMTYGEFVAFINTMLTVKFKNLIQLTEEYEQKEKAFIENAVKEDAEAYNFFKKKFIENEIERERSSIRHNPNNDVIKNFEQKQREFYKNELATHMEMMQRN